jgi:hypothetical protein
VSFDVDAGSPMTKTMRRLLLGIVSFVWGLIILLGLLSSDSAAFRGGAYGAGGKLGLAFGVVLVLVGVRVVVGAVRRRDAA